jgi:peptide/nickel transport system substrate-binding protein
MLNSRRGFVPIIGAAALAVGITACGGSSSPSPGSTQGTIARGGTLNALGTGDVDYLDPNISYYSIGYLGLRQWSRQLYTYPAITGQTEKSAPDLATELPTTGNGGLSSDGLTYTIKIRTGAKWDVGASGRQITAADVIRGTKRTCNPQQPFGGIPDFADLIVGYQKFCDAFKKPYLKTGAAPPTAQSIKAYMDTHQIAGVTQGADAQTVVFKLTHPAAYFTDMLTLPAFSPAPAEVEKYLPGSAQLAQHTISDGPYKISKYTPARKMIFVRNPAWVASSDPIRKGYVDKIVIDMTANQKTLQQQLETGQPGADIDWSSFPAPSDIPRLIRKHDPKLQIGPTSSSNPYLIYNFVSTNNSGALGKNLALRQALSLGISRTELIQVLGGPRLNTPLTHVLPADILGGEQNFDLYPYSIANAKAKLAAAGFKNGLTLKFLYRPASEGSRNSFQVVQSDLKKIGVTVKGVGVPDADFYTKYLQVPTVAHGGTWDLSLAGWGADWYGNSALSFFNPLYLAPSAYPPVGSNFGFYNSPAANTAIKAAASAQTETEAKALWHAADMQVMKDAAFFPITNPQQALYHAAQVHNTIYIPAMQGFDYTNVWIDKNKQGG